MVRQRSIPSIVITVVLVAVSMSACGSDAPSDHADSCLPAAWRTAVDKGQVDDIGTAEPLAVSSAGETLFRVKDEARLRIVSARGTPRLSATVSPRTRQAVVTAQAAGTGFLVVEAVAGEPQIAVPMTTSPPLPSGATVPTVAAGESAEALDVARRVLLVDRNGRAHTLATTTNADLAARRDLVSGAAYLDGTVYVGVYTDPPARRGRILAYDVSTRRQRVITTGPIQAPGLDSDGVSWGSGGVPAPVPESVRGPVAADESYLATDGAHFAWANRDGSISWSDRGHRTITHRQSKVGTPAIDAVTGPFVFFHAYDDSDDLYLLDTRTGGTAFTGLHLGSVVEHGGNVLVIGDTLQKSGTATARRINTQGLPELRC